MMLLYCLIGSLISASIAATSQSALPDIDRPLIEIMYHLAALDNDEALCSLLEHVSTITDQELVQCIDNCQNILEQRHTTIENTATIEQLYSILSAYRTMVHHRIVRAQRIDNRPPQDRDDKPELPELPRDISVRNINVGKQLRLFENLFIGDDFIGFRAPDNLPATYILTWPFDAGINGQVLSTNGTGTLSWIPTSTAVGTILPGTDNAIARYEGTNTTIIQPSLLDLSDLNLVPQTNVSIQAHLPDLTIAIIPTGTGALITSTQGDPRGNQANDFQRTQNAATQVASGDFSFIGGGRNNTASGLESAIVGGSSNTASGENSFIGGGTNNRALANFAFIGDGSSHLITGSVSSIVGGTANTISNSAVHSFIGGGFTNTVTGRESVITGGTRNTASGITSAVVGGDRNTASGDFSFIGGGQNNTASGTLACVAVGANQVAAAPLSFIGGGQNNTTASTANSSIIGSGSFNTAAGFVSVVTGGTNSNALANFSFIGGGSTNRITGTASSIVGGTRNTILNAVQSFIGGGNSNIITGSSSTIGGGGFNAITGNDGFIGGGNSNIITGSTSVIAGGNTNLVTGTASAIVGGDHNTISGSNSFIGGGLSNIVSATFATIGGGFGNTIASVVNPDEGTTNCSVIGGGCSNSISGINACVIAGGQGNVADGVSIFIGGGNLNASTFQASFAVIGGGLSNTVSEAASTVGGGTSNTASGVRSTVPGGSGNIADGDNSFAAGENAHANSDGSFVWADQTAAVFNDNGVNSFNIRATGGVFIFPTPPIAAGTVLQLSAGNQVVLQASSRKFKDNITDLPDSSWLYKLEEKQYNYKANPDELSFGWVAEDVAEVNNDLVNYKDDEPFSIKHLDLLPFIVQELKKLKADLTKCEQEIVLLKEIQKIQK